MNKKASFIIAGEFWMMVVHLFFLIVVAFSIFTIISLGVSKHVNIGNMEEQVIFSSIFISNCLGYEDVRIYPGIIDLNKFEHKLLDDCFRSRNFGSKITLEYDGKKIEKFIDKKFFETESRFCPFKPYRCPEDLTASVVVKDNDILKPGKLTVAMVLKNV